MKLIDVMAILNSNNLYAKKIYGQNFLIDETIVNEIIEKSDIDSETAVIEIGPGLGAMTEFLIKKAKKVLCYEIDNDMIKILNYRLKEKEKLTILEKDFLKANIDEDINEYLAGCDKVIIVANLPYYITTPILQKVILESKMISKMVVMMQKEVAIRICGTPKSKDYGSLSVFVQYKNKSDIIVNVPPKSFFPVPNVDSSVVKIEFNPNYIKLEKENKFYNFVQNIFKHKRKTLMNNMNASYKDKKEKTQEFIEEKQLKLTVRSEELTVETIIELYKFLFE